MIKVKPNEVREGDYIEARFPCGCIERGLAVLEEKVPYHCWYRNRRRMMLCEPGNDKGHIITGCSAFPEGTEFYRLESKEEMKSAKGSGYEVLR